MSSLYMNAVRLGIIGLGSMGQYHLNYLETVQGARVAALCDADDQRLCAAREKAPERKCFTDAEALLDSGLVDAVLVATPHYQHPQLAAAALERDIHVLTEKPVAVSVGAARKVNELAARKPRLKYAAMFQQRVVPASKRLHAMVRGGELGEVYRLTWIVTDWFRPWSYYASGNWRATWSGEGGGVLINQCPHNLDLICWITGMMPRRVTAVAHVGKTHPIETEDEVSAILEYDNGATGHFITSTGEAPGTNLLELAGDRGLVRMEQGTLRFWRTCQGVREFRETSPGPFSLPQVQEMDLQLDPPPQRTHQVVTQNFINAILHDEPLIAPGSEGARSLELGNAMLLSGVMRRPVDLPLDADAFEQFLQDLQQQYGGKKRLAGDVVRPGELRF